MWRCGILATLIAMQGCSNPEPTLIVFEDLKLSLPNGDPLPKRLAGNAHSGVEILMDFIPGDLPASLGERKVHPPAQWRVVGNLTDEAGEDVMLLGERSEFYTYDFLYSIRKDSGNGDLEVLWISPAAPEQMEPGRHYRWARIPLPEEAGEYHLEVVAYPTGDPDLPGIKQEMGEGTVLFEAEVDVSAGELPRRAGFTGSLMGGPPDQRVQERERLEEALSDAE